MIQSQITHHELDTELQSPSGGSRKLFSLHWETPDQILFKNLISQGIGGFEILERRLK